jgi:hypothetical protein
MGKALTNTIATTVSIVDNSLSMKKSLVVPPTVEKKEYGNEGHGWIELTMFGYP